MERVTVWMARVGFLSISACTFGLSFDAIRDVARSTGAVDPALAWIVPLAVDGMIVTATAVLWTESLSGRGWHMFPLLAIIGPAALSMWANIAHASGETLLAQVLAAVPPAGLILSLELVAWQIRREQQGALALAARAEVARADRSAVPRAGGSRRVDGSQPQPASGVASSPPQRSSNGADVRVTTGMDHRERDLAHAPSPVDDRVVVAAADARPTAATTRPQSASVDVGRDDDTGRITLDVPQDNRGKEVWTRIIEAVQQSGAVPSQRELADELDVPRSRVQRAIQRNRGEWNAISRELEDGDEHATGDDYADVELAERA